MLSVEGWGYLGSRDTIFQYRAGTIFGEVEGSNIDNGLIQLTWILDRLSHPSRH